MKINNSIPSIDIIDIISISGTFIGLGVGITVFLAITTHNIKDKMKIIGQIDTLKKDKKSLNNDLKSCQDLIETNDARGIADLSRILRQLNEYKELLGKNEKFEVTQKNGELQ